MNVAKASMSAALLVGRSRKADPRAPNDVDSMSFLAPANKRHAVRGARGVRATAMSFSGNVAQWVAIILIGILAAITVSVLHNMAESLQELKLHWVLKARQNSGLSLSWLTEVGFGIVCILGASGCVLAVPHARGSGLPQLLAYLNGCKLRGFTSSKVGRAVRPLHHPTLSLSLPCPTRSRPVPPIPTHPGAARLFGSSTSKQPPTPRHPSQVLSAKLLGTSLSLAAGLCIGPEGPMIHMGASLSAALSRSILSADRVHRASLSFRPRLSSTESSPSAQIPP